MDYTTKRKANARANKPWGYKAIIETFDVFPNGTEMKRRTEVVGKHYRLSEDRRSMVYDGAATNYVTREEALTVASNALAAQQQESFVANWLFANRREGIRRSREEALDAYQSAKKVKG